jgi:hypothetical protein
VPDSNSTSTSHPQSTTRSSKSRAVVVPYVAEGPSLESGWLLITITEPDWSADCSTMSATDDSSARVVMRRYLHSPPTSPTRQLSPS